MRSRTWSWVVVIALLASAIALMIALPDVGRGTVHASARDVGVPDVLPAGEAAGPPAAAPAPEIEAAAPAAGAEDAEVVPFGDRDLPQEEAIRGRVTLPEGDPVGDAIVVAAFVDDRARPHRLVVAGRVRSEPDGFFIVGPLERRNFVVLAVKEGEDGGVGYATSAMPGAWVDLVLAEGARVTGTVRTRDSGEPVAGARVFVDDRGYLHETRTDEEGAYVLAPLPATGNAWSGVRVLVAADGFRLAERSNVLLENGREHRFDFDLAEGATLAGRVLDARSLEPIVCARVAEGWEPYHRAVETGPDGRFVLPDVELAPNLVFTALAEGYLPQERQSDGTAELEFRLDASIAVTGVVHDPRDRPVPGARVYLHRVRYTPGFEPTSGNARGNQHVTADAQGRFSFDEVLPGEVAVVAFHRSHAPGEQGPVDVPAGGTSTEPVTVTMRHGMTVEGEVRDLDDQPLPDIQVRLQRWWGGRVQGYKFAMRYVWVEQPLWYTDAQGRFRLEGAIPGRHWLSAYDREYGWTGTRIEGVEGQRVTDVVISFAGALIEGRVVSAGGEPVANAWVIARGPKNTPGRTPQRWTQTDQLGRFRLRGLKEGLYDLTGNSPAGQPKPLQDVPAGTTGVELEVGRTQVVSGEVLSARTGRALERFYLQVQPHRRPNGRGGWTQDRGTSWGGWIRSPDGRFERPVQAGRYDVTLKAPGHAPEFVREVIVEELVAPQPLFVTLDAGAGLKGAVTGIDGKPAANVSVQLRPYRAPGETPEPTDWVLGGNDRTDARGRYFIEGLAPGTYVLQVRLGTRGSAVARVAVAGSEMVSRDLQLVPTGRLFLTVRNEKDEPVEGIGFSFQDEHGAWLGWAGFTNKEGVVASQPLPRGRARAVPWDRHKKHDLEPFPVNVVSGETVKVPVEARTKKEAETGAGR